jgi:hypothetical protein
MISLLLIKNLFVKMKLDKFVAQQFSSGFILEWNSLSNFVKNPTSALNAFDLLFAWAYFISLSAF